MMLLHLIKKDILIAKKFVFVTMIIMVGIPLYVMWIAPTLPGVFSFLYTVAIGELILLQTISQEEAKYPKTTALLCAASYPRSTIVKAKYAFPLLLFVYSCVAHTFLMLLLNPTGVLSPTEMLTVLFFNVTLYSVYMPIEFKFGFVKAKFFFMIAILTLSSGPTILVNLFRNVQFDFSAFRAIPSSIKNIILIFASLIIFCVSLLISTKIFSKKEL